MELVYLDTMVWLKEYFFNKKDKKRPNTFPDLKTLDPQRIQLIFSPLASLEVTSLVIRDEKTRRFILNNPYLNILREQRDIEKIKLTDRRLTVLQDSIQEHLLDKVPAMVHVSITENIDLSNLFAISLTYSIQLADALHVVLADHFGCSRFVTDDAVLIAALARMKRAGGVPRAQISTAKAFANLSLPRIT